MTELRPVVQTLRLYRVIFTYAKPSALPKAGAFDSVELVVARDVGHVEEQVRALCAEGNSTFTGLVDCRLLREHIRFVEVATRVGQGGREGAAEEVSHG